MNRVLSSFFWKFAERIAAQGVTFLVSIILARILSPEEYGIIALVTVFITIANVFASDGLGLSLIQKKDADELDSNSVLIFGFAVSVALYLLIYFAAPLAELFYDYANFAAYLRVLGLKVPISAVYSVLQADAARKMNFKPVFLSTLLGSVVSGVVGIAMALTGWGIWALIWQYLINSLVMTLVMAFLLRWKPKLECSMQRVKGLWNYGWKLFVSALVDTVYNQIHSLVIGKKYSADDLAYYNRGQQFPSLIGTNINTTISTVLFPVISSHQDDIEKVRELSSQAIKHSSYMMCILMATLAVVAEPLVSLVLTDKWLPCLPYVYICCFTFAFWPIQTANLQALKAVGRSDLYLKLEIIKKCNGLLTIAIASQFGVLAIALSGIYTTIFSMVVNAFPNKKIMGYGYYAQIKDMVPNILLTAICAGIMLLVRMALNNILLQIFVPAIVGCSVFLLLSKWTKNETFLFLMSVLKKKK